MKKIGVFALFAAVLLFSISIFPVNNQAKADSVTIDTNLQQMLNQFDSEAATDPSRELSSSPFTYVKNNKYFDNIVALGNDALPVIEEKISNSNQDGLQEYILAIAMEKIAKVDFVSGDQEFNSGKDFTVKWDTHLKNLRGNIQSIITSNDPDEIKNDKLVKLGTPAIPFIMDALADGHTGLQPALEKLLPASDTASLNKSQKVSSWIKENSGKFNVLKKYVNSK